MNIKRVLLVRSKSTQITSYSLETWNVEQKINVKWRNKKLLRYFRVFVLLQSTYLNNNLLPETLIFAGPKRGRPTGGFSVFSHNLLLIVT